MAGRKRKSAQIINLINVNNVEPLAISDMKLASRKGNSFCFIRLKYRGVPALSVFEKNIPNLIDAGRDEIIRELYRLSAAQSNDITSDTIIYHLIGGVTKYFRYLDEYGVDAIPFSVQSMNDCITYFNKQALKGINTSTPSSVRGTLVYYLKQMGRTSDARSLQNATRRTPKNTQSALDIETELKPISKVLIRGHKAFVEHLKNNTLPDIHPFYDEFLVNKMAKARGFDGLRFSAQTVAFKIALSPSATHRRNAKIDIDSLTRIAMFNQASRCALFLLFMMTGMNASVLYTLKRSDITFKNIGTGKFVFEGVKGRAGFKTIDNTLGFSKYTKELIESWLNASKAIYDFLNIKSIDNMPLLPYVDSNLNVIDFSFNSASPSYINNLIGKLFPFTINPTRFRKTKSDMLMRVTQDMYIVSQGLNNSIEVVQKAYTSGVTSDHHRNISAVMAAQASIALGVCVDDAVKNAKILHSDILSEYDYKDRLKRNEMPVATITPSGIHCRGDESSFIQIKRKIKNIGIELPEKETKCTSFLSCFNCDNHVLIASESDIWLMLSFFEQVAEMKDIPAQNSIPKSRLYEIEIILSRTLKRLKDKAPDEYGRAEIKFGSIGAHPLYANLRSLTDALELFNV